MAQAKLFGTDGIRAEVGVWPLLPDFILHLGLVTGNVLNDLGEGNTIVVGRDTRWSGPMLQNAMMAGLLASGATVIDVGVITTPGVACLVRRLNAVAGVVVSASHNPVRENGIKFFDGRGFKLPEAVETEIEQRLRLPFKLSPSMAQGRLVDGNDLGELYLENLLSEYRDIRFDSLSLVLDCANGAASRLAPECLTRLGARIFAIHASPTGQNINDRSGSEYSRRQPEELAHWAHHFGANFALAFDGDADRVVFVDERGGLVDGDHILGILARYFDDVCHLIASSIVTTHMRNGGLAQFAHLNRMQMIETPVGDKYVIEKLAELERQFPKSGAFALGGEQAGHVVLMDATHAAGDGIRTALFVMRVLIESGTKSLAELASAIRKVPQVIASAYIGNGPRLDQAALDDLEYQSRSSLPSLQRIHLRYSGTEPQFRAMLEAAGGASSEMELAQVADGLCQRVQSVAGVRDGFKEILSCSRGGLLVPLTE